ncbi:hypothetical protein JW978_01405 [Candidatus Dojkabacteria bacterium]|nr:hypothetical protein [Candidatus Dojkabacteria bacterium]
MVDLQDVCSLPIRFNSATTTFEFSDPIKCRHSQTISLQNLIPALLNKTLRYPENVYEENIDLFLCNDAEIFDSEKLHYEVIILPSGLLGIEYIKSHVYYSPKHQGKTSSIVECLYGILTIIIQKNMPKDEFDFETTVSEGMMIKLRRGEKVEIPTGYFYTFINTRSTPAIFSRTYKNKGIVDYAMLQNEKGLAYFAIRKNARAEIVYNPRYKHVPRLSKYTPNCDKFKFAFPKISVYDAVKKNTGYFMDKLLEF